MTQENRLAKVFILLICFMSFSCKNISETVEPTAKTPSTAHFQSILDSIYQAHPASVGIMVHLESPKHGVSWSASAGYADKDKKTALTAHQPALIASSIKTYVSASILKLQEEGKLHIEDAIAAHLSPETTALFTADGYDFKQIKIKHLLSHTSGIADYVNDDYIEFINKNQQHRWTRDEQLQLATKVGDPLGEPQELFKYADVNYLLATEIIEQKTQKPFYIAMRALLKYEELGLTNTWFPSLEDKPAHTAARAHQYWHEPAWGPNEIEIAWDAHKHDISWDLYGGGGIATTMKELAQFSHHLFNQKIIHSQEVLNLITTDVPTTDGIQKNYRLGISDTQIKGLESFGHGGFWGTIVFYIPKLDASIAVCVLERHGKKEVIKKLLNELSTALAQQVYLEDIITTEEYVLYKAKNTQATLVLYPGGGTNAAYTKEEFDIINLASAHNISVMMMNFNRHIWIDEAKTTELAQALEKAVTTNALEAKKLFIGGMSIGGNVSLTLANYLHKKNAAIAPQGVFIIDSPIDLYALYENALKDTANPDFDEQRLAEPKWIVNTFEEAFTKDALLEKIQAVSPFVHKNDYIGVPQLNNTKLRLYTEPDADWWMANRQTDYENTNAYAIQQIAKILEEKEWEKIELIETENKGYRSNGERHPHSWSIVDQHELIQWILE